MMFGPAKITGRLKIEWRTEVQWFGGFRLFVGAEIADKLRAEVDDVLVFEKVFPDSAGLVELLPAALERRGVFPDQICSVCGSRNTTRIDWAYVDTFIDGRLAALHLINTPCGLICSDAVHRVLKGVRGVVFHRRNGVPSGDW
jgi:hypothetical protein